MTVPLSPSSGEIDPAEGDYLDWSHADCALAVQMHLDAIDGIARDVTEEGRAEVGGLLLGRVESGDRTSIRIEGYQRIPCAHRLGPQFVLDREDQAGLVAAAEELLRTGDLSVVGFYRSHTRPGFELELADFELIGRYFSDPSDLMLLIKAAGLTDMQARFFRRDSTDGVQAIGQPFPFRGRALNLPTMDDPEATHRQIAPTADPASDSPERPRRLVPDFVPSAVEPSQTQRPGPNLGTTTSSGGRNGKWWPLLGAILLVGAVAALLLQPHRQVPLGNEPNEPTVTAPAPQRPLGLYVDPAGQNWRVSWNPNATALHYARNVQLFVRDGDDQNRIDLSPGDLASGSYQYRPMGNDVTFRLEVTDDAGHVSAESFRLARPPATPVAAPAPAPTRAPQAPVATVRRVTEPRAIHRVPPVVPLSIKPRIKSAIPIDVRVHIDTAGRVTAAVPVTKQPSGLHTYLAGRAVEAARLWRFDPARENGKPVPGTETIHFVFEN